MKTITKIDVMSTAKIMAVMVGLLNLIGAILINIAVAMYPNVLQEVAMALQPGVIEAVKYVLSGLIGGFILGAIVAYLYNIVAPKMGGIKIEIK